MAKAPAYLWYPKDILNSERVESLSASEECWYRRALDRSWDDEGIMADPVKAAKRIGKKCTVKAASKILKMFFVPKRNHPLKTVNKKQEIIRQKFAEKVRKTVEAGKASGRKRREQKGLRDEQTLNVRSTDVEHLNPNLNLKDLREDLNPLSTPLSENGKKENISEPKPGNGKDQIKPPNTELGIWLDAIAVAVGARDRRSLLKLKRWTDVCVSAMRENHGLEKMLKAIESERRRVGENVEFFSPEGALQKLQMTGKRSKPAQGPDPESYTYVKNQPSASDDIRAEQDRINTQMARELAAK